MIMYENQNQQGQQYGQGQYEQQQYQPPYQQPYQPQYQQPYEQRYHGVNVKDFTRSAWIAAGVGFLCVYPGLVMAIIYLRQASAVKKSTGVVPQGYGCLWTVFVYCAVFSLLGLVIGLVTIVAVIARVGATP
jgi:F0F1-type ATP synthase membrane subunit c/vacuolar-type H+-ATPase subunit K